MDIYLKLKNERGYGAARAGIELCVPDERRWQLLDHRRDEGGGRLWHSPDGSVRRQLAPASSVAALVLRSLDKNPAALARATEPAPQFPSLRKNAAAPGRAAKQGRIWGAEK